jgi:hypothetical protein
VDDADGLQPGELIAVGAGLPIDDNGAGIDIGVLVVRDRGCRGDWLEEHVVVAEEIGPGGLQA